MVLSISLIVIPIAYFIFLWNTQFKMIQLDCWLYSYTRLKVNYNILRILLLQLDSYHYFFFLLIIWFSCFNFLQHKNMEQQYLAIILHTGCERWNAGQFEGQADCCEWGWFFVINRPILLWLSFFKVEATICYYSSNNTVTNNYRLV